MLVLVSLNNWDVLRQSEVILLGFEPGLVAPGETGDVSVKSQEFALAVEPESTVGDGCWVVELNDVLVSSTIKGELPASVDVLNFLIIVAVELPTTLDNSIDIPVGLSRVLTFEDKIDQVKVASLGQTGDALVIVVINGTGWAPVDTDGMGLVEPEAPVTLSALVSITVVTVLSACGAVSVDVALVPLTVTFVRGGCFFIAVINNDTAGFATTAGWVWVEVIVITVLTVSE